MIVSTGVGAALLLLVDTAEPNALLWIWVITAIWITVRAGFGVVRIWPGIGDAPLSPAATPRSPDGVA